MRPTSVARLAALLSVLCPSAHSAAPKPASEWIPAHWTNYTHLTWTRSITTIFIHKMNGAMSSTINWFQTPYAGASTQYCVGYNGRIVQMVAENDIAKHVGPYYDRNSIGIENDGYQWRNDTTDTQYRALARLTAYLCDKYRIPKTRTYIRAHSDITSLPDHQDPGPYFNWTYFLSLVNGYSSGSTTGGTTGTAVSAALKINDGPLNVRSGPGTGYEILGQVQAGQRYVAVAQSGSWWKVNYDHRTGWVSGSFVSRITGVSAVVVTADVLNVRTGPGTGYAAAGQAAKGMAYVWTRYEGLGGWYEIYWRGGKFFVYGNYVVKRGY